MTNEKMKEVLSAVMDNSNNELEFRSLLANIDDDLKKTWARYHVAKSVMHKEVIFPTLNIASAVSEVIAKESSIACHKQIGRHAKFSGYFSKLAVAASIMAVSISTVYYLNSKEDSIISNRAYTQLTTTEAVNVAVNEDQWMENRLSHYMAHHERQGLLTLDKQIQEGQNN